MSFLETIKANGVVGAGGAGFPTHIKFNAKADTLIINAVECEPLLETDKYLMRNEAESLVRGIELIGNEIEAKRKVIAIKSKNIAEINAVTEVIDKYGYEIEVFGTGNFYPAGDEQTLLIEVTGIALLPGEIPLSAGVIVTNVSTVIDVERNKPVTHRLITVAGSVKMPTLIRVPVGTTIKDCIEISGGATVSNYDIILGGPMMGKFCKMDEVEEQVVTKTLGGIIILPKGHLISNMHELSIKNIMLRASAACIQCRMCTDLCPRFLNGHPLHPHSVVRSVAMGDISSDSCLSAIICCECGICELYACPMGLSPRAINKYVKAKFAQAGVKWKNPENISICVHKMRKYRKVPTDRLISRLNLNAYVVHWIENVIDFEPNRVEIKLKQHIGIPAMPIVKNGDYVKKGDLIASINEQLGANVHSSIDGIVIINQNSIIVEKR